MEIKQKAAFISVISNTSLIILKITVGVLSGSISIISEAIHSLMDLIASLIALFAVKKSIKPPDDDHHWGHLKIEHISGFIEAILIFLAAILIIIESFNRFKNPQNIKFIGLAFFVMVFSATVNFFISKYLLSVSKKTFSIALKADAMHLLTDVYTSLGVGLGLGFIYILEELFPNKNFHWIDPLFAFVVSLMIIKATYELTKESINDLMDKAPSEIEIRKIKDIILNSTDIISFRNFRMRKVSNKFFIEFDLILDKEITFEKAHSIADEIQNQIKREINSDVMIHFEPCFEKCKESCLLNCKKNT